MKVVAIISIAAMLSLGACSKSPSDKLANRVETAGDKRADAMEANADALRSKAAALDNNADKARETAESRAAAIKAADMNVAGLTQEQRDAIVANKAPAVH